MAEFISFEPFGIDDGELDRYTPQEIFALGVEWQMIADLADKSKGFERYIHSGNQDRVRAILDKRNRQYSIKYMKNDLSEDWMWVKVEKKD